MTLLSTVAAVDGKPTRQARTRSAAQLAIREADDSGSAHLGGLSAVSVQLRIGPKLMLALAGLLAATVMVSGVAVAGLGAVNAQTQELYHHNLLTTQAIAELQATLDDAAGSALQLLLFEGAAERSRLLADLRGRIVPRVDERIAALQKSYAADPDADPARPGWSGSRRAGVPSSG
jgi:hypothetical protein